MPSVSHTRLSDLDVPFACWELSQTHCVQSELTVFNLFQRLLNALIVNVDIFLCLCSQVMTKCCWFSCNALCVCLGSGCSLLFRCDICGAGPWVFSLDVVMGSWQVSVVGLCPTTASSCLLKPKSCCVTPVSQSCCAFPLGLRG